MADPIRFEDHLNHIETHPGLHDAVRLEEGQGQASQTPLFFPIHRLRWTTFPGARPCFNLDEDDCLRSTPLGDHTDQIDFSQPAAVTMVKDLHARAL